MYCYTFFFFFSSRRRHTRSLRDWSSDVCSSDLAPALELGSHAMGKHKRVEMGYLSRVEIELDDGTVVHGDARPFPGHHKNPFTDADLDEKLRENVEPIAGAQRAARLTSLLWSLDKVKSTRELTKLLAFGSKIDIDSVKVRER